MNKKGIKLLGETTVRIIISLIVVIILIVFITKLYGIWSEDNKIKKITKQLENIVFNINEVNEKGNEKKLLVFPEVNWYLKSFPDYDFPIGECRGDIGCLCFCEDVSCNKLRKCEGFEFDVQVISSLTKTELSDPDTFIDIKEYPATMQFIDEAVEIIIVKEDIIKIFEFKNYGKK